jgi:hypothetical protein
MMKHKTAADLQDAPLLGDSGRPVTPEGLRRDRIRCSSDIERHFGRTKPALWGSHRADQRSTSYEARIKLATHLFQSPVLVDDVQLDEMRLPSGVVDSWAKASPRCSLRPAMNTVASSCAKSRADVRPMPP